MEYIVAKEFEAVSRRAGPHAAVVDDGVTLSYDRVLHWSETISMQLDGYGPMKHTVE